ncbi:MAG: hypothetical protein ACTSYI_16835, partial [Promethearchaeota archaeon]
NPATSQRKVILILIFVGTLSAGIVSMYFIEKTLGNWAIWQKWLPILFSSIILIYSLEMIRHSGKIMYITAYFLAISWGLFISLTPLGMSDPIDHFAIYALLMGIFWLIFGGIRLRKFVKNRPILKDEDEYSGEE